jgi:hypothetical protein
MRDQTTFDRDRGHLNEGLCKKRNEKKYSIVEILPQKVDFFESSSVKKNFTLSDRG